MGQGAATLAIFIDNPGGIYPGQLVHGKLYLDVRAQSIEATSIVIRIVGIESSCIRWTTSEDNETQYHSTNQSCLFYDISFPIVTLLNNQVFKKGQYEFPFTFELPSGLPQSIYCEIEGDSGGHASITYSIEAKLHREGWMKWDIKEKQNFNVLSPPVPNIPSSPAYVPPLQQQVVSCCCFNRGDMKLGLLSQSSILAPNENFELSYVIDNNSKVKIKAVEFRLSEIVDWRANGRSKQFRSDIFFKRIDSNELPMDLNPLKSRSAAISGNMETLGALKAILDSHKFSVSGYVGNNARFSVSRTLLSVRHEISVKICTSFGTVNPFISYPILLQNKLDFVTPSQPVVIGCPIYNPVVVSVPPGWAPVVAEPVALPVSPFMTPVIVPSEILPESKSYSPPPLPKVDIHGLDQLFYSLSNSYDQLGVLSAWLLNSDFSIRNNITPSEFGHIFSLTRSNIDKILVAEKLALSITKITCAHIVAALTYSEYFIRSDIVSKLAPSCIDKYNKGMVRQALTPFQFMCIENAFK